MHVRNRRVKPLKRSTSSNLLENSSDWITGIADEFTVLLETTIRYAYLCYDVGRKMSGSYTEHLRKRDKYGKKQKVDEALFHQHYREVLQFSALFSVVNLKSSPRGCAGQSAGPRGEVPLYAEETALWTG